MLMSWTKGATAYTAHISAEQVVVSACRVTAVDDGGGLMVEPFKSGEECRSYSGSYVTTLEIDEAEPTPERAIAHLLLHVRGQAEGARRLLALAESDIQVAQAALLQHGGTP